MTSNGNKRKNQRNLAEKKREMLNYEAGAVIQLSQKLPTFKGKAAVRSK